jgi:hypothetical protein
MVPPVPIPNTVVKHLEAESTCMETCWEDRKLPVKKKALNISVLFLSSKKISLALNYKIYCIYMILTKKNFIYIILDN